MGVEKVPSYTEWSREDTNNFNPLLGWTPPPNFYRPKTRTKLTWLFGILGEGQISLKFAKSSIKRVMSLLFLLTLAQNLRLIIWILGSKKLNKIKEMWLSSWVPKAMWREYRDRNWPEIEQSIMLIPLPKLGKVLICFWKESPVKLSDFVSTSFFLCICWLF